MKIETYTGPDQLEMLLRRPSYDHSKIEKVVKPILQKVKRGGDKALKKFALEYDHVELEDLWVSSEELVQAGEHVSADLKDAINVARNNIHKFHHAQKQPGLTVETLPGVVCRRRSVPIQKVGLYVPGGTAPLFSTVLMLGVPAVLAGCETIVLSTPTNQFGKVNPVVLYTAHLLGIDKVLKLGGAQAIAAMAYGTETVPKIDKIFGPGNQYVTVAKQMAARDAVAIDMPAGPSEVMVVIDAGSNPSFAASDLLSQAEHGIDSQVVLVTDNRDTAESTLQEVEQQLQQLPRKDIARKALDNSVALVAGGRSEMVEIINHYGPEHLILNLEQAVEMADQVVNAGSVFIGPYTPESVGDYASGTNHTLPTNGWANAFSGVSLDSFVKKITYQQLTADGLKQLGPVVEQMAAAEQLEAHKLAVTIRLQELQQ